MNLTTILFGVLPLVIFVLIDSFAGVKAGIISALVFALLELAYTLVMYKQVDGITLTSLGLVLVFGLLTYQTGNDIFFKVQPVLLGIFFGVALLVMQALGKPLLVILMEKYQYIIPESQRFMMLQPAFLNLLKKISLTLGWGFLLHAGLVWYAAFHLSNWWWLAIRGIGVYIMMFGAMFFARFL